MVEAKLVLQRPQGSPSPPSKNVVFATLEILSTASRSILASKREYKRLDDAFCSTFFQPFRSFAVQQQADLLITPAREGSHSRTGGVIAS